MNMGKVAEQCKPPIHTDSSNGRSDDKDDKKNALSSDGAGFVNRHQVRACNPEAMHRHSRRAMHVTQGPYHSLCFEESDLI